MRFAAVLLALSSWLAPVALAQEPAVQQAPAAEPARVLDTRLVKATELVLASDRYLHHSKLRRGMTGYGLTVLEGTKIVRFDVQIVSVMFNFGPQQDVILARASGQNLEQIGIVQGMSGSPIYVNDGAGDKLIGALAYGFPNQKSVSEGQLCGIQPVCQMLAASGVCGGDEAPPPAIAGRQGGSGGMAPAGTARWSRREWLEQALTPEKADFFNFGNPNRRADEPAAVVAAMRPLATPVMVGRLARPAMEQLSRAWAERGFVPVQAGGLGQLARAELEGLALAPGSAMAIPMITGDVDITAVGTVTELIGNRVLGFGHALNSSGRVSFPLATGYIHAVVPHNQISFKLGGSVQTVGELTGDEESAVSGTLGGKAAMVPIEIEIAWADSNQQQSFRYAVVHDRDMTAMLAGVAALNSLWSQRTLPLEHSLEYDITAEFEKLGTYRAANLSSGADVGEFISDLMRPIAVMHRNPFGAARLTAVKATVRVEPKTRAAEVLAVRPDRNRYHPGQEVTATVTLRRYLGERFTRQVRLRLGEDLPPDQYVLRVGGSDLALEAQRRCHPRLFQPQNLPELLGALNRITGSRADQLVAVVDVPGEDTAVNQDVLAGTPPTVAAMLRAARPVDVTTAGRALVSQEPLDVTVRGHARAELLVEARPAMP